MADRPVVIVSNRGPLAFRRTEDGDLVARRGAGGLVSAVAPLVAGTDATWVAAALTDADRDAARTGVIEADGLRVLTVAPEPEDLRLAYDVVSNEVLWFAHHGMFDGYRTPTFDVGWPPAWEAYRRVNQAFADALVEAAPPDADVLIQDYHLTLVAASLAERRPDLVCVHFSHTPFAEPSELRPLPAAVRTELLGGLAAHRACGFHSERWADAARRCAAEVGVELRTFVTPLGPDPDDLAGTAASDSCARAGRDLEALLGDRLFLVRVDRIELSKNILRGFLAFDRLLESRPQWRGRVVFGAFVYPSRGDVEAYRRYREDVEATVAAINERWGTDDWTPIAYEPDDDYPRSVAALQRADAVVVNPVRDGLNLVAKEAVLLSQRDATILLSEGAGAWDELAGAGVVRIDAHDVVAASESLHLALSASPAARLARATTLREVVGRRTPATWLADQVAAARDAAG